MIRWAVGLVRRALGTLLLLLLLLSGAEVAVRLHEIHSQRNLSPLRTASTWEALTTPSWTVRQELRPLTGLRIRSADGDAAHDLRINSFGLRGGEVEVPKPSNVFRVLCLGDESLLAVHLPETGHLCHLLQEHLQAQTKLQVDVSNAGVPGGCPLTEFLLLTHRLAAIQPDLVVVAVNTDDLTDDFRYRRYARYAVDGLPLACRHPSLSRKTRTNSLSTWRSEFRLVDLGLQWAGDAWRRKTEFDDTLDAEDSSFDLARLQTTPSAIEKAMQPLTHLAAWCRNSYATLCVFHVPAASEDDRAALPDQFLTALKELAIENKFLLVEASRSAVPEEPFRPGRWTAEEHRQFALQLGERLIAETPGPWKSPYFQPIRPTIAPASLEFSAAPEQSRLQRR